MYRVDISPAAEDIIRKYYYMCLADNGETCANRYLDSYDANIGLLETNPKIGCGRLRYVPAKYKVFPMWEHLWFVFQIYEEQKVVKIEYVIDDRQNYGEILK